MSRAERKREFTGRHMLAIMIAFFGVIITVNLTMAYFARSSWTGFVVENRYVASSQFNDKVAESRAQAALGWKPEIAIADGEVRYRLVDSAGKAVAVRQVTANFRRPAYASDDREAALTSQPDGWLSTAMELGDGAWIVEIDAEAGLDRPYRTVRRLTMSNGAVQ